MLDRHEISIEVRYHETDAQGHVHHATYFQYFELGRVEMLRAAGIESADLERQGTLLVVSKASCQYFLPCRFGETLRLIVETVSARGARIHHAYRLFRHDELLAKGATVIACIRQDGKVQRLPRKLMGRAQAVEG